MNPAIADTPLPPMPEKNILRTAPIPYYIVQGVLLSTPLAVIHACL
jgi:hypothetical protein